MSKIQHQRRINNVNNYINYNNNSYNTYNNNNNYNNNYNNNSYNYNNYNSNNNNYNNNNYNNYNNNNNNYFNNGYNYKKQFSKNNNNKNNFFNSQTAKKKRSHRYNNNNNFYENSTEEIMSKSVNEIKQRVELMRVKINIKDNKYKELIIYKDDDIYETVSQFCTDNYINEKLIEPLCNKINQSLDEINIVTNYTQLNRDGVLMLEKAKQMVKHKLFS